MSDDHVPSTTSRQLGRELRALREGLGITCDRAAAESGREVMWLVQIECGQGLLGPGELEGLLDLYLVTDDSARRELADLAGRAGGPDWLKPHGWLTGLDRDLIILEAEASRVRAFGLMVMPDLVRTEAYQRAVSSGLRLPKVKATVEEELDLLAHRQRHRNPGVTRSLHVILDESVVCQLVGGKDTMRDQLRHLVDLGATEHTVVQLIPREVGAHCGLDGAFHILDFPRAAEPAVSISHSALGPLLTQIDLDGHFTKLAQTALSPAESLFMIEQALGDL